MKSMKLWIVPVLAGLTWSAGDLAAQEPETSKTVRLRKTLVGEDLKGLKTEAKGLPKVVDFRVSAMDRFLSGSSPSVRSMFWSDLPGENVEIPTVSMAFEFEGEKYALLVEGEKWQLEVDGQDVSETRLKDPQLPALFSTVVRNDDGEVVDLDVEVRGELPKDGEFEEKPEPVSIWATSVDGRFTWSKNGQMKNVLDASGDPVASVRRDGGALTLRFLPRSKRAWLGVEVQPVTEALAEHLQIEVDGSCLISAVREGSPAEKAKLRTNDLIIRIDDSKVSDSGDLIALMSEREPGQDVTVTVMRKGKTVEVPLTLGRARANPSRFFAATDPDFGDAQIRFDDFGSTRSPFRATLQGVGEDAFPGALRIDGEPFVIEQTSPGRFPSATATKDVEARLVEMEKTLAEMRALMQKLLKEQPRKD